MTTAHFFDQLQLAERFWPWRGINASPQNGQLRSPFSISFFNKASPLSRS